MADTLDCLDDFHSICLRAAAKRRGIAASYEDVPPGRDSLFPSRWLKLPVNGRVFYFARGALMIGGADPWGRLGRHVNEDANLLIRDKHRAKDFLRARGFSVPAGTVFRRADLASALRAFDGFGGPVCVKPNQGQKGEFVFTGIRDRERYEDAVRQVAARHPKILVEESVGGQLIRFFFVRPRVIAAKLSRPASVVGDGVSDVARLIAAKNARRAQRAVPGHVAITIDDGLVDFLAMQGRGLTDVPPASERVFLRGTSNGALGADSIACGSTVHPSYAATIAAACNAVDGLNLTAVDVVIADPAVPARPGNHWILEMNRNPGLTPYHFPWRGEGQDVSGAILDFLSRFEEG